MVMDGRDRLIISRTALGLWCLRDKVVSKPQLSLATCRNDAGSNQPMRPCRQTIQRLPDPRPWPALRRWPHLVARRFPGA